MEPKDYKNEVYKIIGAAMEVHGNLGGGLLEPIYNEALTMELADRGINAEAEKYLACQRERYAYDEESNCCYLLDRNMEDVSMLYAEEEYYEEPYADVKTEE